MDGRVGVFDEKSQGVLDERFRRIHAQFMAGNAVLEQWPGLPILSGEAAVDRLDVGKYPVQFRERTHARDGAMSRIPAAEGHARSLGSESRTISLPGQNEIAGDGTTQFGRVQQNLNVMTDGVLKPVGAKGAISLDKRRCENLRWHINL